MSAPRWFQYARLALLDLIFPPRCAGCGRAGEWFCAKCVASLHRVREPICGRCGQELSSRSCLACRRHALPAYLHGLRAVAHHDGQLRKAIHRLKYERLSAIAEPLGQLLCDYLDANPLPFTLIVPVPLHDERQRERGYNQSALLADVVSRRTQQPAQQNILVRTRHTIPQVGLNEHERRQNLIDAFACVQRVDDAQVLLIDDVCTTGSTMSECAAALHAAGARSVWGLTLAR